MKKYPFTEKIIDQFFEGSLSEEQHLEVLKWFSSIPEAEQMEFMEAHIKVLDTSGFEEVSTPSDYDFNSLVAKIEERSASRRRLYNLTLHVAASILPFVFCWFLFQQTSTTKKSVVVNRVAKIRLIRLKNPLQVTRTVQLSDLSTVDLYPGSTLQYPEKFSTLKRDVQLEGKAFFNIKHENARAFIVQTGILKTVVLGTSFWVDATLNGKSIEVKVKTGKVGLISAHQPTVFLLPSERAVFDLSAGILAKVKPLKVKVPVRKTDGEAPTAIVFNNTPLKQVAKILSESFGKTISVQESIGEDFTVSLTTKGKPITTILQEIKSQIPIDYEIEGSNIFIKQQ